MDREITKAQIGSIVTLLVAGKVPFDEAQVFIDKYKNLPSKKKRKRETRDLIQVPDLTASQLVELAQKELKLNCLDPNLATWNFVTDERGKTYEVKVWKPSCVVVSADEVRKHFKDGFVGNTAAFVAWVTKHNPEGYHATIPADDRLFQYGSDLCAPYFYRGEGGRSLNLCGDVRGRGYDYWSFVAFREVK